MSDERPDVGALADLDAGLVDGTEVDEPTAQRLRAAAAAEPGSAAVLDALAATRAELGALPAVPVPPAAAARWADLIDELAAEPVPAPIPLRSRRARWMPRAALVAAAVLVAIVVVAGVIRGSSAGRHEIQGIAAGPTLPAVSAVQLASVARESIGVQDAGGLDDPTRRGACLRAAVPQVSPGAPLLGARRVDYEGTSGVLLVLGTGRLGAFDIAVVDPVCGPAGGRLLTIVAVP